MFANWKQNLKSKKRRNKAVADSRHWKTHPPLQAFLQTMRGSCTVAPMDLHEALTAVVNIALAEDTWTQTPRIPADFLPDTVYILWNDAFLPVLKADCRLLLQNPEHMTAVAGDTFLISDTMDRVVHFSDGTLRLYSVAPED